MTNDEDGGTGPLRELCANVEFSWFRSDKFGINFLVWVANVLLPLPGKGILVKKVNHWCYCKEHKYK